MPSANGLWVHRKAMFMPKETNIHTGITIYCFTSLAGVAVWILYINLIQPFLRIPCRRQPSFTNLNHLSPEIRLSHGEILASEGIDIESNLPFGKIRFHFWHVHS
jgi:hypothetical protein